jgi:hypothetical protein
MEGVPMAVPVPLTGTEPGAPEAALRGRWAAGHTLDHVARTALAGLCDAIEGEVVTITRRLGACQSAAQDEARALAEGLAGLAARLAGGAGAPAPPEPAAAVADPAGEVAALANLAASLLAGLDRSVELIQALPRRTIPLLRRSGLADRRRHARVPVARACSLLLAGRRGDCLTLDLSEGGALVRPLAPWPELDDVTGLADLELEGVGRLPALLVGRSAAGLHLAFRMSAPTVRAALGQLLREARRAERALLGTARRIVDDLLSWRVDAAGRLTCGLGETATAVVAEAAHAEQVLELHLRREPRLVGAALFAPDGSALAARATGEVPEEPPLEAAARPGAHCRVVVADGGAGRVQAWLRVEAEVGDAARAVGSLRLYARP